ETPVSMWKSPPGCTVGEPVFCPRVDRKGKVPLTAAEEADGYIVVQVYDSGRHSTYFALLDARDISRGPICSSDTPITWVVGPRGCGKTTAIMSTPVQASQAVALQFDFLSTEEKKLGKIFGDSSATTSGPDNSTEERAPWYSKLAEADKDRLRYKQCKRDHSEVTVAEFKGWVGANLKAQAERRDLLIDVNPTKGVAERLDVGSYGQMRDLDELSAGMEQSLRKQILRAWFKEWTVQGVYQGICDFYREHLGCEFDEVLPEYLASSHLSQLVRQNVTGYKLWALTVQHGGNNSGEGALELGSSAAHPSLVRSVLLRGGSKILSHYLLARNVVNRTSVPVKLLLLLSNRMLKKDQKLALCLYVMG
ncbi:hypothetical protein FOZ63_003573, partial [Perkinsus olseni]